MFGTDSFDLSETPPFLLLAVHANSVIDGDTVRGEIMAPKQWENTLGHARRSQHGEVWVRLLGLDAPETHFPSSPNFLRHQPASQGLFATACLNQALGIAASLDDGEVQLFPAHPSRRHHKHQPLAYLLAEHQGVDRFGRLLAFVWKIHPDLQELVHNFNFLPLSFFTSSFQLESSVNFFLLADGAAYPDFHFNLGQNRIARLRTAVKQAQTRCLGIWDSDQTRRGIFLSQASRLAHDTLILPRLYRRIAAFLQESASHGQTESGLRIGLRNFLGEKDQSVQVRLHNSAVLFSELLTWDATRLGVDAALEDLEWH